MNRRTIDMKTLIANNKKEILEDKKELERIEKKIDEKHLKKLYNN